MLTQRTAQLAFMQVRRDRRCDTYGDAVLQFE
jgi:hypothetical protein